MKITYDKKADAVYIYTMPETTDPKTAFGIVARTEGDWPVHLDFSKDGKLLGVEIMDASGTINIEYLRTLDFVEYGKENQKNKTTE
jgi:uncharacterized protein YuzE